MNKHDEIKQLLKSSRMLLSNKTSLNETYEIRKQYGILTEQDVASKINVGKSIEKNISSDKKERKNEDEKTKMFRILNGLMYVIGTEETEFILTEDEKNAFIETMNEFVKEVSDSVDFGPLMLYSDRVVWSGFLNTLGVKFEYITNDDVYISFESNNEDEEEEIQLTPMVKVDDEFKETINKLQEYYKKFKSKWNEIIGARKQTKIPNMTKPTSKSSFDNGYETF